jgi:hypothetical protein
MEETRITWDVKQQIAYTLAMVTRCDAATQAVLAADVPTQIATLLDSSFGSSFPASYREPIQRSCVECLGQLSHAPEGKTAIRQAGGIQVLARLLDGDDSITVSKALQALMGLTFDIESKELTLRVRLIHC